MSYLPWQLLRLAGFTIRLDGERLMVCPPPGEAESAFIRENREALVWACQEIGQAKEALAENNRTAGERWRKKLHAVKPGTGGSKRKRDGGSLLSGL